MRWRAMFGSFMALCWVLAPLAASAAEDVEAQLQAMQERMDQLEARLDSTTDQLAEANQKLGEQHTMIERAARTEPNSGAVSFLESLEVGGWLAADYWYNFNHPSNERTVDGNIGTVGQ